MKRQSHYPFDGHEDRLLEYTGIVNANGTVYSGCSGVTVVKTGTGTYTVTTKDIHPIYSADYSNTSMANSANGTGVTKTLQIFACPIAGAIDESLKHIFVDNTTLNANGTITFRVNTLADEVATDNRFSFKAVMSTSPWGKK